jgi:hypothetical protein
MTKDYLAKFVAGYNQYLVDGKELRRKERARYDGQQAARRKILFLQICQLKKIENRTGYPGDWMTPITVNDVPAVLEQIEDIFTTYQKWEAARQADIK